MAFFGRAAIYLQKGEFAKATSDASEAIRLGLHGSDVYTLRGFCYVEEDRTSDAVEDFTQALRLNPRDELALQYRGESYRVTRDYPQSIVDLTELIRITQAAGAYEERARTFFRSGQYSLALADYQHAAASPGGTVKTKVKLLPWLRATCPDPSFRNGQEAVTMALKDCEKTKWKDSGEIDTRQQPTLRRTISTRPSLSSSGFYPWFATILME